MDSDNLLDDNLMGDELKITEDGMTELTQMRKWAGFLAILGFVMLGLLVLSGLIQGVILASSIGGGEALAIIIGVLLFTLIYFFPILYLFKSTSLMKQAIAKKDIADLNASFRYLKMHYRYIGIFAIIILSIYLLAFASGLGRVIFSSFML